MTDRVVVTGATGAQGAAIARAFAEAGHEVVGLTRSRPAGRPDLMAVDARDADALARAFEGAAVVAFTSPVDHRPGAREGLAARVAAAAGRAGVARVVVNTAAAVPDGLHRPVADALRRVREAFEAGAAPSVVIEPTCYMENLLAPWVAAAVAAGALPYPAPRGARVAWLSHATLGAFAVAAAPRAVAGGRTFRVGGAEALTGDEVADRLGRATGRPVRYEEAPLDGFAAALNGALGAPAGDDIADYYRHLRDHPEELARGAAAATDLGVEPETMAAWAARRAWPAPGGAPA